MLNQSFVVKTNDLLHILLQFYTHSWAMNVRISGLSKLIFTPGSTKPPMKPGKGWSSIFLLVYSVVPNQIGTTLYLVTY